MSYQTVVSIEGRSTGKWCFAIRINAAADAQEGRWEHIGITRMAPPTSGASPLEEGIGVSLDGYASADNFGSDGPVFSLPIPPASVVLFAFDLTTDPETVLCWAGIDGTWVGTPGVKAEAINQMGALDSITIPKGLPYHACAAYVSGGVTEAFDCTLLLTPAAIGYPIPAGFSTLET